MTVELWGRGEAEELGKPCIVDPFFLPLDHG